LRKNIAQPTTRRSGIGCQNRRVICARIIDAETVGRVRRAVPDAQQAFKGEPLDYRAIVEILEHNRALLTRRRRDPQITV
jgi:hypothetical protein